MKKAQIIHNPTAGNGAYKQEEIIAQVENSGFTVNYISTDDEDWESFIENEMDVIFLAGGDGTVRKLAGALFQTKMSIKHIPVYLIPLGTANNIATSLGIFKNLKTAFPVNKENIKKFTCGHISGLKDEDFFLEGVGFGIFPELISKMKDTGKVGETTEEKLKRTFKVLLEIVKNYEPRKAKIKADGIKISGNFLLVELMNINYIGPNLEFAPNADVEDDFLDLVLIPEKKRKALVKYVESVIDGTSEFRDMESFVKILRVQKIKIKWKGSNLHVDDILVKDYSGKVKMKMNSNSLDFFTSSPIYKEILK